MSVDDMNAEAGDMPVTASETVPGVASVTRPLYWSVRRELWENRSIVVVPLIVTGVALFGFLMSTITQPGRLRGLAAGAPGQGVLMSYVAIAGLLSLTALLVGAFYCLDALHGERRDRSILFWKSLPVSDGTTVLAKASIPLLVLPLIAFGLALVAQLLMLLVSSAILLGNGAAVAALWSRVSLFGRSLALLYGLAAITLWYAPIYAWLLLVSGWARRATFLWAVLPLLAAFALETMALRGAPAVSWGAPYRLAGWFGRAFAVQAQGTGRGYPLSSLTPLKFLSTPGLWIGLAFAAAFLAAAVRLRRSRDPI